MLVIHCQVKVASDYYVAYVCCRLGLVGEQFSVVPGHVIRALTLVSRGTSQVIGQLGSCSKLCIRSSSSSLLALMKDRRQGGVGGSRLPQCISVSVLMSVTSTVFVSMLAVVILFHG